MSKKEEKKGPKPLLLHHSALETKGAGGRLTWVGGDATVANAEKAAVEQLQRLRPKKHRHGGRTLPDLSTVVAVPHTIPGDWLAFCTMWTEPFQRQHCGQWLYGVAQHNHRGWLVWDVGADKRAEGCDNYDNDELHAEAMAIWDMALEVRPGLAMGVPLPQHYYRLNREAAVRGYLAMMVRSSKLLVPGGIDWYERADANSYDVAIQLGLWGEVRYT